MIDIKLLEGFPTPFEMGSFVADVIRNTGVSSLPEFTQPTRLTPVVLVDKALTMASDDSLTNILQTMLAIYTSHYMQAVALTNTIDGIDVVRRLDQFSTNRDTSVGTFIGNRGDDVLRMAGKDVDKVLGLNSYKLPDYSALPALEAGDFKSDDLKSDDLQGHVNLAVGRLIHVRLGDSKNSITMPVSVVLNPIIINSDALPSVMLMLSDDISMAGRWHKWRSGEIESFVDYALALDLIERDRKALMNDTSGIYKAARDSKRRGFFASIMSGRRSLNAASAMAVITKRTAEELEMAMKGQLKRRGDRERYFRDTNSMMVVVVDAMAERVYIYQRGIDQFGIYTYSDIKSHSKGGKDVDIASILKAYKLGEAAPL